MERKKYLLFGNWKMNGSLELIDKFAHQVHAMNNLVLCVPYIFLNYIEQKMPQIKLGAQDCAANLKENGAFTGDIAAKMIKDIGADYVIIGHSERRKFHNETKDELTQKIEAANAVNLKVVFCVGETLQEREKGETFEVIARQIDEVIETLKQQEEIIIAYEPVWAIGTGVAADIASIEKILEFIKEKLDILEKNIKLLYGGSVNLENIANLSEISLIDGFLIGAASLDPDILINMNKKLEKL